MLSTLGYTAILLGVLVFVHELGHFLVAKAFNVKVLTFSLGFGPKVVGFRRGETEYRLSLLPLGGYVKMAQENEFEELPPEEAARGLLAQAPWKRALIFVAGPAMNLIFPILIYFFASVGVHDAISSRVGYVSPGLPAAMANIQPGDRIVSVAGQPVSTFEQVIEAFKPRIDEQTPVTVDRDGKQLNLEVTPVKSEQSNALETVAVGVIGIRPDPGIPVIGVPDGSKAAAAGLKTFDRVVAVNGQPVRDESAFLSAMRAATGTVELQVARFDSVPLPGVAAQAPTLATVKMEVAPATDGYAALGVERADLYLGRVIPKSPAEAAGLQRGDRLVAINGKPVTSYNAFQVTVSNLKLQPFELTWRSHGVEKHAVLARAKVDGVSEEQQNVPMIGVEAYQPEFPDQAADFEKVKRYVGPAEAFDRAVHIVPEVIRQTALSIVKLVTGDIPASNIHGPIAIAQYAKRTADQGMEFFLSLMAVISINLGVMNLLPIPILDGFHLLAAGWEAVRRRPIPVRVREVANLVGLVMLVALMALAFKNDIAGLLAG